MTSMPDSSQTSAGKASSSMVEEERPQNRPPGARGSPGPCLELSQSLEPFERPPPCADR